MKNKYGLFVALALALGTFAGMADTIANLDTGVNGSGMKLSDGSPDTHWSVTPISPGLTSPQVTYLVNGMAPGSWGQTAGIKPDMTDIGDYTYTIQFSVNTSLYSAISLSAKAWADDSITSAVLNATTLIPTAPGSVKFYSADMSSFANGLNILTLTVHNAGEGFTGFILTGAITATAVPEASEWAMLIGAAGLGLLTYRKKLVALMQGETTAAV